MSCLGVFMEDTGGPRPPPVAAAAMPCTTPGRPVIQAVICMDSGKMAVDRGYTGGWVCGQESREISRSFHLLPWLSMRSRPANAG